jgi:hypothetical protein
MRTDFLKKVRRRILRGRQRPDAELDRTRSPLTDEQQLNEQGCFITIAARWAADPVFLPIRSDQPG